MKAVVDIETNHLVNPSKVWVICAQDVEKGTNYVFRQPSDDVQAASDFLDWSKQVDTWVGHNWLEFDYPVLSRLMGLHISDVAEHSVDTLVLSRLINFADPHGRYRTGDNESLSADDDLGTSIRHLAGHSIESYGVEFGLPKIEFSDWSKYSKEMEEYCYRDVEICKRIYMKYKSLEEDPEWRPSILLEHQFQLIVNDLHNNGFAFNTEKASKLLDKVQKELGELDKEILDAYPPRLRYVREVHPKLTRYGTLNKSDFRWVKGGDLSEFTGDPFSRCEWVPFNPASHKQLIDVLTVAGWSPVDKTATHVRYERERRASKTEEERDQHILKYGWKINETNLATLPERAPKSARLLAKRILLESRRRTLTEWLSLVSQDGRIHGKFYGIGAWTHRMAHQKPNTANIPNEYDISGKPKLLGREFRSLWIAPRKRLLVGVDAEGIQLRIFAHYIDDKEFTDALVKGKKADKSDPHSLNQRILGSVCKSRAAAKRFIYALLLGAGIQKLSQILECSEARCKEALDRLLQRYTGWALLKKRDIPRDGNRGYFIGLDGRRVPIPGVTASERRHLCMSGYLQNGEAIIMKLATTLFYDKLKDYDGKLVNFVHDEWQTECPNNANIALDIAKLQSDALRRAGEALVLKCPLAGSYYNDEHRDYTIGTNWYQTH